MRVGFGLNFYRYIFIQNVRYGEHVHGIVQLPLDVF